MGRPSQVLIEVVVDRQRPRRIGKLNLKHVVKRVAPINRRSAAVLHDVGATVATRSPAAVIVTEVAGEHRSTDVAQRIVAASALDHFLAGAAEGVGVIAEFDGVADTNEFSTSALEAEGIGLLLGDQQRAAAKLNGFNVDDGQPGDIDLLPLIAVDDQLVVARAAVDQAGDERARTHRRTHHGRGLGSQ